MIGGGLAGCEAALQLAEKGYQVKLYEMRPLVPTPAHETGLLAELVCSNSLKSTKMDTGSGLLKEELRLLGCKLLEIATSAAVDAGNALAVDRELFAKEVQRQIETNPNIEVIRREVKEIEDGKVIIATGPLTSEGMMRALRELLGEQQLFFFDAIAPIVDADSLDYAKVYAKSRYDKGEADYLNCAFDRQEYQSFVQALLEGEKYEAHEFEDEFFAGMKFSFYENCTPIEELARRGVDTLRYGVMRPIGLERPEGKRPYAVLQLRSENKDNTAYNLVGCQTMLRYGEQKRVFRLIPGLEKAEFLRYGSIHRNSYLNSPDILNQDLSLKSKPEVYIAGQLSGVEGYVESIASGLMVTKSLMGELECLPKETIMGQLWRRLITPVERGQFSPVNANFGLLPALDKDVRDKKLKRQLLAERSLEALKALLAPHLS